MMLNRRRTHERRFHAILLAVVVASLIGGGAQAQAPAQGKEKGAAPMTNDDGLVTHRSRYDVRGTIERFETAVRAHGWVVFTVIDHAMAAKAADLSLRPRFVIVFGNPKAGTGAMAAHPTLAIDLPLKALVWQDDDGGVWLTLNSADWMATSIYSRHGISLDDAGRTALAGLLAQLVATTTE
jgi:uncharacterized protein (DUF302 family)